MNSSIKIVCLKWISLYDVQFRLHFWRKIKFTILAQFGWAKAVYVIKRPLARFLRTCHDRKPLKLEISWFKITLTRYGPPLVAVRIEFEQLFGDFKAIETKILKRSFQRCELASILILILRIWKFSVYIWVKTFT